MTTGKPHSDAPDKAVVLYTTFPGLAAAEAVAADVLAARLAACANIIPAMVSIYNWKGQRHRDDEVVMLLKTRAGLMDELTAVIRAAHAYDNPAIVALDVVGGSSDYLAWVTAETRGVVAQSPPKAPPNTPPKTPPKSHPEQQ